MKTTLISAILLSLPASALVAQSVEIHHVANSHYVASSNNGDDEMLDVADDLNMRERPLVEEKKTAEPEVKKIEANKVTDAEANAAIQRLYLNAQATDQVAPKTEPLAQPPAQDSFQPSAMDAAPAAPVAESAPQAPDVTADANSQTAYQYNPNIVLSQ